MTHRALFLLCAALCVALSASSPALAQTGVSDDRVSLPEGPGSLSGIGDDVSIDPNMGAMAYSVPIQVPAGYPAMTPGLTLAYSSSAGSSVLGMGWSLATPSIERLTMRGVPRYDSADEITADAGVQLVLVETAADGSQVYRARFEGAFVRYTWRDVGDGAEGYWTAELPDGRVAYYGATSDGVLVESARVGGGQGTFRYLLVDMVDVWGHRVRYGYEAIGQTPALLTSIGYVFDADGQPDYTVTLSYEAREDWIDDATGGFEDVLDQRLASIAVAARGTTIRTYALGYDDYADSGGFTRLASVRLLGVDGSVFPAWDAFTYSQSLGGICGGDDCGGREPYVQELNTLDVALSTGDATLVDMNGDALPDLVDTSLTGKHRIYLQTLNADGSMAFAAGVDSAVGERDRHQLSNAFVQVLDADGDGFTDMMNAATGRVLMNAGEGDWAREDDLFAAGGGLPGTEAQMGALRFLDYDNDHRIDLIGSSGSGESNTTTLYRNTGAGFVVDDAVEPLDAGFDSGRLELNDFNGDGLLDAVLVGTESVTYQLNLGWGRWTEPRTAGNVSFTDAQAQAAEIEDINGDGLSDMVLVGSDQIELWINRNGRTFDDPQVLTSADVAGDIPTQGATTVVLFADMNGNGSSDVVWFTPGEKVRFLEIYPLRPNLLTKVENGLGWVSEITYGTSVQHMARDGGATAWTHRIPFPNTVVDELDEYDQLTQVHRVTSFAYHDGYYDGVEKSFRGFEHTEEALDGDDGFQEAGLTARDFDVAADGDPYGAGDLLRQETWSADRLLEVTTNTWGDCAVADVPDEGLLFPVRWVCLEAKQVERVEGADEADRVTLRDEYAYDGYGNTTLHAQLGVVARGGNDCGAGCQGDEMYTASDFIAPSATGRWLLSLPWRVRTYAAAASDPRSPAGAVYSETLSYYDGEPFVGLALGAASEGSLSRETRRVDADGAVIESARLRSDAHGNTIESIDPGFAVDDHAGHRTYEYDAKGLRVEAVNIQLDGPEGEYALRQEIRYDALWDQAALATNWLVVKDGETLSPRVSTTWAYDVFGRPSKVILPGDSTTAPTWEYSYEVTSDFSRIVAKGRSQSGGEQDVEMIQCVDGRGRVYQNRDKLADGDYLVSGLTVFTRDDKQREVYQPWRAADGDCELVVPDGTASVRTTFDALGRPTLVRLPGADGEDTEERYAYAPDRILFYDPSDTEAGGPFEGTPEVRVQDGLGRQVAVGRTPSAGAEPEWYTYAYDGLGALASVTDPLGNARENTTDMLGRVVRVEDPDRGVSTFAYNGLGDLVRAEDAAGNAVVYAYDGARRITARYVEGAQATEGFTLSYDRDWAGACPGGCGATAAQLVSVSFPLPDVVTGTDWYRYDSRQRGVGRVRDFGGFQLSAEQDLDNLDRVTGERFSGGVALSYALDASGRAVSIDGYVDAVGLDARGDVTRMTFSNGAVYDQVFDRARRRSAITVTDGAGAKVVDLGFERSGAGWITAVTDGVSGDGHVSAAGTFGYDAFGRLTSAALAGGGGVEAETVSYGYDAGGNIVSRASSRGAASPVDDGQRTLAGAHRTLTAGDLTMSYDARGAMVTRGDTTLTFDGMARLVATNGEGGRWTYAYAQDTDRAMERSDDSVVYRLDDRLEVVDGVASVYVSVGNHTVARHETCELATTVLSDLNDDSRVDSGDAWLAFAAGQGWVTVAGEASPVNHLLAAGAAQGLIDDADRVTFFHRDQVDNLVAVTDEDGAVVEETRRYPFGLVRWSSADGGDVMGFTDKRTDPTGLVHIGARVYDPALGRWTAADPKFEVLRGGDANTPWEALGGYVYGWNTPLNGQDESGADWTYEERDTALGLLKGISNAFVTGHIRTLEDNVNFKTKNLNTINRVLNKGWEKGYGTESIVESVSVALEFIAHFRTELERHVLDASLQTGTGVTPRLVGVLTAVESSPQWRDKLFHLAAAEDVSRSNLNFFDRNTTGKGPTLVSTAASMQRGFKQMDAYRVKANKMFGQAYDPDRAQNHANTPTVRNGKTAPQRGLPAPPKS